MRRLSAAIVGLMACASAKAAQPSTVEPVTELGKAAAAMKPGEWREFQTKGYSQQLVWAHYQGEMAKFNTGADSIFNYCNSMAWDPKTRKVFFVGLGHYAALKFITYSADTNEWTLMPVPPWADPQKLEGGRWPLGHAYCKNDVDPARRWFLFGYATNKIYRYDIEKSEWIDPIPVGPGMPTFKDANSGIRVFPELGGIVRFWHGRIDLYEPDKKAWRLLGDHPGVGMHGLAAYSAKAKVLVFGGGDVKDPPLYRLDATGQTTRLKPLPFPEMHVQGTIFTADPVTGQFLAGEFRGTGPRTMYALDAIRDEWKQLPAALPDGKWLVATAVPDYGVTMVCTASPAKVWLYKHLSPWTETTTKPTADTPPVDRKESAMAAQPPAAPAARDPSGPAASQPADPSYVVLWGGGTRIPVIDITAKGTLLAFAQNGGGDYHPNHIEVRRSTDGGATWSKAEALSAERVNNTNPSSLVDFKTGTIWVFWTDCRFEGRNRVNMGIRYRTSNDDGLTWSPITPLTIDGKPLDRVTTSCARGIQLSTGRLLLPCTRGQPFVIYSDDHGKTWHQGNPCMSGGGSLEFTLLELADGRVYLNHRNNVHRQRNRQVAFSKDGGITWSNPEPAVGLVQPTINGCHSGLARLTHPKTDDKSRVLFSAPWGWGKDDFGRENLAILISYDECQTWKPLKMLQRGNTSYSNLVVLPDKSIGCIYEFTDLSEGRKIWQQVRFIRFTLEWLTDGKDKVVPKDTPSTTGGQPVSGEKVKE